MTNSYLKSRLTKLERSIKEKIKPVQPDLILTKRADGWWDWDTGITYTADQIAELRQSGKVVELCSSEW